MKLLVFPHKLEMDLFLKHWGRPIEFPSVKQPFVLGRSSDGSMACSFSGQGKVQMALCVQWATTELASISEVFLLGSAGALVPHLNVGQVIVGATTVEHDFKSLAGHLTLPTFPGAARALEIFSRVEGVMAGAIASGDEDIVSPERAQQVGQTTEALCVAWEGAGAARACKMRQIPFTELRAITDHSNGETYSVWKKHLETAMQSLATVFHLAIDLGL